MTESHIDRDWVNDNVCRVYSHPDSVSVEGGGYKVSNYPTTAAQ